MTNNASKEGSQLGRVVKTFRISILAAAVSAAISTSAFAAPQQINSDTAIDADGQAEGAVFNGDYQLSVDMDSVATVGATEGVSFSTNASGTGSINFTDATFSSSPTIITGSAGSATNHLRYAVLPNVCCDHVQFHGDVFIDNIELRYSSALDFYGDNVSRNAAITYNSSSVGGMVWFYGNESTFRGQLGTRFNRMNIIRFYDHQYISADMFSGKTLVYGRLSYLNERGAPYLSGHTYPVYVYGSGVFDVGLATVAVENIVGADGGYGIDFSTNGGAFAVSVDGATAGLLDVSIDGLRIGTNTPVEVNVISAPPSDGAHYTIISSNAPVTVPSTITDNSATWDFSLSQSGNDLLLTALKIRTFGGGASLASWAVPAGNMLDTIDTTGGASTGMQTVLTALGNLATDAAVDAAVAETAPIINDAATSESMTIVNQALGTIDTRLASLRSGYSGQTGIATGDVAPGTGMWLQGFGRNTDQNTRGDYNGYDNDVLGIAVGIDRKISGETRVGVAYSYGASDVDMSGTQAGDSVDIDSHQLTVYGTRELDNWYIDGSLTAAYNKYDGVRNIAFMGTQAKGDWDGWQMTARLSGGYDIALGNGAIFTPMGLAQYTHLSQDGYTETGAGALNLKVDSNNRDAFTLGLGGKIAKEMDVNGKTIIPEFSVMWLHDVSGNRVSTTAQFANDGGKFTTDGANPERNALRVNAGVAVLNNKGFTVTAMYDGEFREDYKSHGAILNARYEF